MRIATLLLLLVFVLAAWLGMRDSARIDDLSLALRTLARESKMNLVVDDTVIGKRGVSVSAGGKTAGEVFEELCRVNNLSVREKDGLIFVSVPMAQTSSTRVDTNIASTIRQWTGGR